MKPLNIECLDNNEQQDVIRLYVTKGVSQVDLAKIFMVSRRSIQRVLEYHNVLNYNYSAPVHGPKKRPAVAQPSPTKQMNMVLTTTVSAEPSPEEDQRMLNFLHDHKIDLPLLSKLVYTVKEVANVSRSY